MGTIRGFFGMFKPLFAAMAIVFVAAPALAFDRRASQDCDQIADPDRRIAGCTRLLESRDLSNKIRSIAYSNRGIAHFDKGEYDIAIADYGEAIQFDPKSSHAYNNRGNAYLNKGEYDIAISDYGEALRREPNYAFAFNNRGLAYTKKGDNDHAIADFSEAVRIDPKYAKAFDNRGFAYSKKGDYDRAIADENEAIRIDPKSANAYNNRGIAYARKGDDDHAFGDYDTAVMVDPKHAFAHSNRGRIYLTKGDFDRAIADFNDAIQINPQIADTWLNRGRAYDGKGDVERSIASYSEAIRLDPRDTRPLTWRGLDHEKRAEIDKARTDFSAALAIVPRSEEEKRVQAKARERLAALSDTPAAAPPVAAAMPSTTTAVAVATAPFAVTDHRIALVIGNSAYENVPALPNPAHDAALVAETLKRTGFESVTVQTDLRKDALVTALRNFARRAENADWAVVYYAGHGMEVGGVNYLIPVDAKIASDRDIGFEAVALEQVLNAAERARKLRLVILDACRDNPFASQMKRTLSVASRSVTRGLAAVEPEAGTLVVYAAKDGETANDGDGGNSPFARAFVKNLQTPGLEVRRLFDTVRDDVMDLTGRRQQPFSYGSISGRQDFYFVANK